MLSKNLNYGFKITALAAMVAVAGGCASAKKEEMAEMAAPAPEVKIVQKEVVLDATELFAFDSAELSAGGMSALDNLISQAGGEPVATISVTGHTDQIGDENYNMSLSQQRADTAAKYMVSKGIPAGSIMAMGKGESEPVVQCAQSNRKELVECLAPNRRVVVEYPMVIEEEMTIQN